MNALGDIVLAEVPCLSCGYNLRMQPVEGRCPECSASIAGTLEKTLLLCGHSQIRRIAGAMRLGAILNIGVAVVLVIFIIGIATWSSWTIPILCFIGLAIYAFLQVIAAIRTTTPPPARWFGRKRLFLIIGGSCFVTATLAPQLICVTEALLVDSFWPEQFCYGTLTLCFPGVGVFIWMVGAHYTSLCTTGGLQRLAPWPRRIAIFLVSAIVLIEIPFVLWLLNRLNELRWGHALEIFMELSFFSGLLLTAAGLLPTTILLFMMSNRFRTLAKTAAENPLLTGPPPASTTTNAQ